MSDDESIVCPDPLDILGGFLTLSKYRCRASGSSGGGMGIYALT
jgi:hypothetical protein